MTDPNEDGNFIEQLVDPTEIARLEQEVVDFGDAEVEIDDDEVDSDEFPEVEETEVTPSNYVDFLPDDKTEGVALDSNINRIALGFAADLGDMNDLELLVPQEGYEEGEGL